MQLNLLTLPVRRKAELQENSQQILKRRPDLAPAIVPILMQRLHTFSLEQIMVYVNIPTDALRHSRAAQELLAEGQASGEVKATLRQLTHRCGPLSPATTARIQALPLEQLEALGLALLDFSGSEDLAAWLAVHAG